jgi:hypothetical protein
MSSYWLRGEIKIDDKFVIGTTTPDGTLYFLTCSNERSYNTATEKDINFGENNGFTPVFDPRDPTNSTVKPIVLTGSFTKFTKYIAKIQV